MDATAGIGHAVDVLEPGGRVVHTVELTGGVSANVIGVEIETAAGDRRRVVFRQHRSADFKQHGSTVTATEYGVLAALHSVGLPVPRPYLCDDSGAATPPYLVIEWVDGATALAAGDVPAALDQMAQFLVELHALDPSSMSLPGVEPIEDPAAAVLAYLPSSDAGQRAAALLGTTRRRRPAGRRVLLHGDYWPGNVMWRDGRLVAVIDWEDARLGDPRADLATARVELLCQYGDDAMEHFTACYLAAYGAAVGPLPLDALALWEVYVSAAALATMGSWGLEPAAEAERRRRTETFFERAVGALG